MALRTSLLLATLLNTVFAGPLPVQTRQEASEWTLFEPLATRWDEGAVTQFPIHSSCNESQYNQLREAFTETIKLAAHARDHVLRWSNESEIFQKFFGNLSQPYEVIGSFSMIVDGDKARALFRCDDPDGNCEATTWGGHWRGANASDETVICPTSFLERRPLSTICSRGYQVSTTSRLVFWASDVMHRLYHVPTIGRGYIEHYSEGYAGAIEAAQTGNPNVTHDSDILTYFALEAYANDVAVPGEGCPGPAPIGPSSSAAPVSSISGTPTVSQAVSSTLSVPPNCHTHDDGSLHCD